MTIHNTSKILDEKITTWKNELIDLSRRNRLLNFRSTKATTIKIVDEIPSEVFKSLVINSDSFHFLPKEEKGLFNQSESESTEESKVDSYPHDLQQLEDQHIDDNLQTNLTEQRLQKNLKRIHFRANQLMEEQGYNILYLTLAMLQWHEADHSDLINKSPLIMVPVEIHRKSIKSKYKLYRTEEDPFINPALQHKLSYEFDLNLPDLEEEIDPQEYLSKIIGLIENNTRWKVTSEIYLGLFSFAKFVMFKDLDKYSDVFKNNKIIQALAGVLESKQPDGVEDYITAAELDEKREPLDLFQVLDADSSQQEAIEAVKSGRSIVIQGPPGTGKSQVITNLIAEALALGKKVLFVSEKMAALDVVYRRLQSVGIGDYCLEIHSRKANKRYVLDQLKDAYEAKYPGNPIFQSQIDELLTSRKKLTDYSFALHSPVEPFGKNPYWIFGQLNQMRDAEILNLKVSNYTNVSFYQYQAAINILESVRRRIEEIGPPTDHPFWGCLVEDSPSKYDQQGLIKQFKILSNRLAELSNLLNDFSAQIGININTPSLASSYCKLLAILSEDHAIPESLGAISNAGQYFEELQPTLSDIEKYQEQREKIRREYDENIFSENISQIHDILANRFKSFWRIFVPEYYKLKKVIKTNAYEKIPLPYSKLLTDVGELFSNIKLGEK